MSEFLLFQSHLSEPPAVQDKPSRSKATSTHSLQPPAAAAHSPQAQHSALGLAARSSRAGTAQRYQVRLCNVPLLPQCRHTGCFQEAQRYIPKRVAQHRAAHSRGMSHFLCSSAPARLTQSPAAASACQQGQGNATALLSEREPGWRACISSGACLLKSVIPHCHRLLNSLPPISFIMV